MKLKIKRLTTSAVIPEYKTSGAAGMDLTADLVGRGGEMQLRTGENQLVHILLAPGQIVAVPTGLSMAISEGFEGQIRPRSGLVLKYGLTVANTPGTIDSDYRGEVKVLLYNISNVYQKITHGERIAQLVIARAIQADIDEVKNLDETERGEGGFGSTGA